MLNFENDTRLRSNHLRTLSHHRVVNIITVTFGGTSGGQNVQSDINAATYVYAASSSRIIFVFTVHRIYSLLPHRSISTHSSTPDRSSYDADAFESGMSTNFNDFVPISLATVSPKPQSAYTPAAKIHVEPFYSFTFFQ